MHKLVGSRRESFNSAKWWSSDRRWGSLTSSYLDQVRKTHQPIVNSWLSWNQDHLQVQDTTKSKILSSKCCAEKKEKDGWANAVTTCFKEPNGLKWWSGNNYIQFPVVESTNTTRNLTPLHGVQKLQLPKVGLRRFGHSCRSSWIKGDCRRVLIASDARYPDPGVWLNSWTTRKSEHDDLSKCKYGSFDSLLALNAILYNTWRWPIFLLYFFFFLYLKTITLGSRPCKRRMHFINWEKFLFFFLGKNWEKNLMHERIGILFKIPN